MTRKRKLLLSVFLLLLSSITYAQVEFTTWSNNYMQLNSINGNTSSDAYTLFIKGNGNINLSNWKLSVRLKNPISAAGTSVTIPPDKIVLVPSRTTGTLQPSIIPTIAQIGIASSTPMVLNMEQYLVSNSMVPLVNQASSSDQYYELKLYFNLVALPGNYLSTLPTWADYYMDLEFKLYNQNNTLLGVGNNRYNLQVGVIPQQPLNSLTLQIAGNGRNGVLELVNANDYNYGTSVTYPQALVVRTNTAYEVKVKSLSPYFTSSNLNTLPLNVVKVELLSHSSNNLVYPKWLSTASQVIAEGPSTNDQNITYDIRYSSKPNAIQLFDANMDDYVTTLQYEILPK
jgi:hypothetical protein